MKFEAKIQEKRKGGKKYGDSKKRFLFLPQDNPFEKGDKVAVGVKKVEEEKQGGDKVS